MRRATSVLGLSLCVFAVLVVCAAKKGKHSRGFNAAVDWKLFDQGIKLAEEQGKVAIVLIHKTWCGACKGLAKTVEPSKTFAELSEDFVMINVEDKEEPTDPMWHPDGAAYVPRVHFYDGHTRSMLNISCDKCTAPQPFFYSNVNDLVASMRRATKMVKKLRKEEQEAAAAAADTGAKQDL